MKKGTTVGVQFGEEVAGKTIVGGRARRREGRPQEIPIGIEKVLYLAAVDEGFRGRLLEDRAAVLSDAALGLDESERAILGGVSDDQLSQMIASIDPVAHGRRRFLAAVAGVAASLAAGAMIVESCGEDPESADAGGHGPDIPRDDEFDATITTRGISPDVPDGTGGGEDM